MEQFFINLSTHYTVWVYALIILTACIEGPVLSMIFGVLIKLGYFPLIPVYIALMLGDLFGDSILYIVGHYYGHSFIRKFGKYFSVSEDSVKRAMGIFHKYKYRILVISKMTNGFGLSIAVLLSAGMARIPYFKYITSNLIGQFVWSGLLISFGYLFSDAYLKIDNIIGRVSLIGFFIFIVLIFIGFTKYMRKKTENV